MAKRPTAHAAAVFEAIDRPTALFKESKQKIAMPNIFTQRRVSDEPFIAQRSNFQAVVDQLAL